MTLSRLLAQSADGTGSLSSEAQIFAVIVAVLVLLFVVELVRRRRLVERYALLWMLAACVMVLLAVWNNALNCPPQARTPGMPGISAASSNS